MTFERLTNEPIERLISKAKSMNIYGRCMIPAGLGDGLPYDVAISELGTIHRTIGFSQEKLLAEKTLREILTDINAYATSRVMALFCFVYPGVLNSMETRVAIDLFKKAPENKIMVQHTYKGVNCMLLMK